MDFRGISFEVINPIFKKRIYYIQSVQKYIHNNYMPALCCIVLGLYVYWAKTNHDSVLFALQYGFQGTVCVMWGSPVAMFCLLAFVGALFALALPSNNVGESFSFISKLQFHICKPINVASQRKICDQKLWLIHTNAQHCTAV